MQGTAIVPTRSTPYRLDALGIYCDAREVPYPLNQTKPEGTWVVGDCKFAGSASELDADGRLGDVRAMSTDAKLLAALAVTEGRVIGIVAPLNEGAPAIWWSWPLDQISVRTRGTVGVVKKRPDWIFLEHRDIEVDGTLIALQVVGRHWGEKVGLQYRQESSLLAALGGSSGEF